MTSALTGLARPILESIDPYIPGKPIWEVAREFGVKDIIKLASNENPAGPSPLAMAAVQAALGEIHLYPDGAAYTLRHKLAEKHDWPPEGILLGNGSVEIMEIICEAFLERGWEAITGPQAFFKYRIACQIMGVQPVLVPMPEFNYDVDGIIKAITPRTRLVFIANPNNPTGTYLPKDKVDRLVGALPDQALLILDEAYVEYIDKPNYQEGIHYLRQGKRLVVTRSFSKVYGLAGLRCGYALTHPDIAIALNKVREVFNCNLLAQIAAEAALADEEFLARSVQANHIGLAELQSGLKALGLNTVPSVANFVLTEFSRPIGPLFIELLKRGVIVRPMEPYGLPTCARITVGLSQQHQKLFEVLKEVL